MMSATAYGSAMYSDQQYVPEHMWAFLRRCASARCSRLLWIAGTGYPPAKTVSNNGSESLA